MEWAAELGGAQAAAIALAVLFGALLVITCSWGWLPRRNPTRAGHGDPGEIQGAVTRLYAELPQFLQEFNGRLDAKMHALRRLLDEATITIDELRRLQTTLAPNLSSTERPAVHAAAESPKVTPPVPRPLVEGQGVEGPAPDTTELRSQRYAHVYSLEDSGLDPAEISGETGMHRGEVELVLNLRHKRVRADRGVRSEPTPVVRSSEEAPA